MKKTFLAVLSITLLLFSCDKNKETTLHWDQTGCSNPWDDYISLDSFTVEAYHEGINDYLTEQDITVYSISSELDSTIIQLCLACHCKTGEVISIRIPTKDKRKLKRLVNNNQFGLEFY